MGKTICEIEGKHAIGVVTSISDVLFQITCPRCVAFALFTQTDLEKAIIDALTKEGRYTDIERIA